MFNWRDWFNLELVRRSVGRDENNFIQIQGFSNRLSNDKMCIVRWIERTAKETDLQEYQLTSLRFRFLRPLFHPEYAFLAAPLE